MNEKPALPQKAPTPNPFAEEPDLLTLEAIAVGIEKFWLIDKPNYPELPDAPEEKKRFALAHCSDHLQIAMGEFARLRERRAHGKPLPDEEAVLLRTVFKMIFNALKIAEVGGMPPQKITHAFMTYLTTRELP
jgi:hypothetical protein